MSNFILATISIVYALVCLTKESDQGMFSMSIPVEDCLKKEAGGKRGTPEKIDPPKVALK
jgi:hypothetical protein